MNAFRTLKDIMFLKYWFEIYDFIPSWEVLSLKVTSLVEQKLPTPFQKKMGSQKKS